MHVKEKDFAGTDENVTNLTMTIRRILLYYSKCTLQVMVNEEIEKIENWMYSNKLTLNYSKCCFRIISCKPLNISEFSLTMSNLNIKRSDCVKYLGVLLDDNLTWKNQVQKLNKSRHSTSAIR